MAIFLTGLRSTAARQNPRSEERGGFTKGHEKLTNPSAEGMPESRLLGGHTRKWDLMRNEQEFGT